MTAVMTKTLERGLLRCLVLVALLVCSFGVAAQESPRIGYVNMKRVIDNAPQTQRGRQKLEQQFASRNNEILEMEKRLGDLQNKLLRDAKIMTDAERADLELLIRSVTRDVRRLKDEYTEDFTVRFSEEQNLLIRRVDSAVKALAQQENMDLVLPDTSVVYASERVDITDKVLQRLRDEFESEDTQ